VAIAFYLLGWLLIAAGILWNVVEAVVFVQLGRAAALVPILVAGAYVMLAGALFLAIGGILRRLDRIVANTMPWDETLESEDEREAALQAPLADIEPPLTRRAQ
jgi:hypothetical protein